MRSFEEFVQSGEDRAFDETGDRPDGGKDWYEHRHELEPGMVFTSCFGIVRLDHRKPGDGTQWVVDSWYPGRPDVKGYEQGHWSCDESTIEPGDLIEQFSVAAPAIGMRG